MPEKLLINKIWLNSGCGVSGIYREWENKRRIVKDIREIFQKLKNMHGGLRYTYHYFIPGQGFICLEGVFTAVLLFLLNRLVNVIITRLSLVVRTLFGSVQIALGG